MTPSIQNKKQIQSRDTLIWNMQRNNDRKNSSFSVIKPYVYIHPGCTGSVAYCCVVTVGLRWACSMFRTKTVGVSVVHTGSGVEFGPCTSRNFNCCWFFSWPYIQLPEPLESHGPQLKKLGLTWTSWKINVTLSQRESCGMEGLVAKQFKGTPESLGISFQFWYLCCSTSSSLKWRCASVPSYTWRKWWRR